MNRVKYFVKLPNLSYLINDIIRSIIKLLLTSHEVYEFRNIIYNKKGLKNEDV